MAKKIRLRVVSPTRNMYDNEVEMVILRGSEGDIGIMPGHEPLTLTLAYGMLRIFEEDLERKMAVLGGFAEIKPDCITVLSDAAEWPEEIDVNRAEAAKERAERRLSNTDAELDVQRAALALRRALVRIEVSAYPIITSNKNS